MVKELKTVTEFAAAIGDEKTGVVVIDFFADWCGPCKRIAPLIDTCAKTYEDVGFYKINVENKDLSKICDACKIKSLPTFCFFVSGKYVNEFVGANATEVEKLVNKNLETLNASSAKFSENSRTPNVEPSEF